MQRLVSMILLSLLSSVLTSCDSGTKRKGQDETEKNPKSGQTDNKKTDYSDEIIKRRNAAAANEKTIIAKLKKADSFLLRTIKLDTLANKLAFSPDGTRLASANFDGTVSIWDLLTGELVHKLKGPDKDQAFSVAFSAKENVLVSASGDHTLRWWNASTGKLFDMKREYVLGGVTFSPDGGVLATDAHIWDGLKAKKLHQFDKQALRYEWSPDGNLLARIHPLEIKGVELWNRHDMKTTKIIATNFGPECLFFSPDGKSLGLSGKSIAIIDLATGKQTDLAPAVKGLLYYNAAFAENGKYILSSTTFPHVLQAWNVETRKKLEKTGVNVNVGSLKLSPGENILATMREGADTQIFLWAMPGLLGGRE